MNTQTKKQPLVPLFMPKMPDSILRKDSNPELIKEYFIKILELKKEGESFPVNLDEVWPLAYSRRDKAFSVLRHDFIEGEDYNLHQKGKVVYSSSLINGIKIDARLAVSCLEYFIAKKTRSVFEVYRKVFHASIEKKHPTAFNLLSKKLEDRYVRRPEFNEIVEIVDSAILACGSANQLASRIGVSGATLSLIKSRPWLVSIENLHGIELACRNLLSRDAKPDTETFEQILMIPNCDLRISIFTKMKKGGLI